MLQFWVLTFYSFGFALSGELSVPGTKQPFCFPFNHVTLGPKPVFTGGVGGAGRVERSRCHMFGRLLNPGTSDFPGELRAAQSQVKADWENAWKSSVLERRDPSERLQTSSDSNWGHFPTQSTACFVLFCLQLSQFYCDSGDVATAL